MDDWGHRENLTQGCGNLKTHVKLEEMSAWRTSGAKETTDWVLRPYKEREHYIEKCTVEEDEEDINCEFKIEIF